jgi:tetratricopeptide (TPR) repeat protein
VSDAIEQEIRILRAIFWSERDPDGRAFVPLADAYLRDGNPDEALSLIEEGLSRHPDFASAHLVAARAHRARGDESATESALRRVLEFDPGNAMALRMKGELAEAGNNVSRALDAFREAFRRNPGWEDLEGRIERLAAGLQGGISSGDADRPLEGSVDVETVEWDPSVVDLDGELDLGDAFDAPTESGSPEADGLDLETAGDPDGEDPPEFDAVNLERLETDLVERERTGDLEAHEALAAGPFGGGEPTGTTDDDFIDPFGFEAEDGEADGPEDEAKPGAAQEPEHVEGASTGAGNPQDEDTDAMVTRTLGELYARQGLTLKALEVFEVLALRHPDDEGISSRLEDLRREVDGEGSETPQDETPQETEAAHGEAHGGAGMSASAATEQQGTPAGVETEEDSMAGISSWGARESGIDVAARMAARPVGAWFGDLLAWAPGAVPIEDLAPSDRPIELPVTAPEPAAADPAAQPAEQPEYASEQTEPRSEFEEPDEPEEPVAGLEVLEEPEAAAESAEVPTDPDHEPSGETSSAEDRSGSSTSGSSTTGRDSGPEGFEGLDDFQEWLRSLKR